MARLAAGGARFVAGEVTLVERPMSEHERYELSPTRTRLIFSQKGWSRVIGFHTRNVPHRVHEFIQLRALDMVHADGLYISPVIGPKKSGDFLSGPILQSYQVLLESGVYPPGKVVLGAFSTYSRYCGPREAVFTAICRKNMGCDYFVVRTRSPGSRTGTRITRRAHCSRASTISASRRSSSSRTGSISRRTSTTCCPSPRRWS